jgi:flagellin-like protein
MKIFRSRKALSPVVASIILIAVTVAVSIAVAAWMGALTFNFMATEQLKITNVQFGSATNMVNVTMQNTGTTPVTINEVHINNGATLTFAYKGTTITSMTLPANTQNMTTITFTWTNGAQYEVEMRSTKGNQFTYSATAPG